MKQMKSKSFVQRLGFALAGLAEAWRREKSFRAQVLLGLLAVLVTTILHPGFWWAAVVAIAIALVLAFELVNSAIEHALDHLHPESAPEMKLVKDVAAAAVLIASLGALCVGAFMIADWFRH